MAAHSKTLAFNLHNPDAENIDNSTLKKKLDFAPQETLLGQMLVHLETLNVSFLQTLTKANRKVLIEWNSMADAYANFIRSHLGRHAAKGAGRFLHVPAYWAFRT